MSDENKSAGSGLAFARRASVAQVEEGNRLAPRFDAAGLIPVVTSDAATGEVLMLGYMNAQALARTIETGDAHCHVGYRSCFYRRVPTGEPPPADGPRLVFVESEKTFDPLAVYGDAPN